MTPQEITTAEEFGSLIYELREDAYLTQAQLAAMLGVSQGTVSRWEHGRVLPNRRALERVEGVAPGYFQEMRFLWLRGRWEMYHDKARPKRPEAPPKPQDAASLWQTEEGET